MGSSAGQTPDLLLEELFRRLGESHEGCVYEAIERLVRAGEVVGLDADGLLRMLDRGMTFEELVELIETKMECLLEAA
jgi:hypothetical protein